MNMRYEFIHLFDTHAHIRQTKIHNINILYAYQSQNRKKKHFKCIIIQIAVIDFKKTAANIEKQTAAFHVFIIICY